MRPLETDVSLEPSPDEFSRSGVGKIRHLYNKINSRPLIY